MYCKDVGKIKFPVKVDFQYGELLELPSMCCLNDDINYRPSLRKMTDWFYLIDTDIHKFVITSEVQ